MSFTKKAVDAKNTAKNQVHRALSILYANIWNERFVTLSAKDLMNQKKKLTPLTTEGWFWRWNVVFLWLQFEPNEGEIYEWELFEIVVFWFLFFMLLFCCFFCFVSGIESKKGRKEKTENKIISCLSECGVKGNL